MIIYNGFKPGESRVTEFKPRKADKGHTIVRSKVTWDGGSFNFSYRLTCECGKSFGSRYSSERPYYAYNAHRRAVQRERELTLLADSLEDAERPVREES